MLLRCCEYNGITVVTPYEFRHTFVSIAKNLPATTRKALLCGEEIKVWCKVWCRHKNNRLILA